MAGSGRVGARWRKHGLPAGVGDGGAGVLSAMAGPVVTASPNLTRRGSPLAVAPGGALQDLLDVDFHLPKEGRGNRIAVALVGQQRHVGLPAQGFEDRFGNAVGQAVERTDEKNAVVALVGG